MVQKTKKEHYVPQFYLESWSIPNTHQVNVYDKKTNSFRVNNISDVACERYFYDVKPSDIFSSAFIEYIKSYDNTWDPNEYSQGIERLFSEEVEKPGANTLKKIIEKALNSNRWQIKNCYAMSETDKLNISQYLSFQLIRTKQIRQDIIDTSECMTQILHDMGVPELIAKEYYVTKDVAKNIHIKMLIDEEKLSRVSRILHNLTWMIAINRTNHKLYTSDNPIGTYGHIYDSILPMNGIGSRGVEVFVPLSPDILLIMVDGTYHTAYLQNDRRYIELFDTENVEFYNSILASQAGHFVFSCESDMQTIKKMLQHDADSFVKPRVQMLWGGNTYCPAK